MDKQRTDMIKYLQNLINLNGQIGFVRTSSLNVQDIIKMLQQPIMPEQPTDELIDIMVNAVCKSYGLSKNTFNELPRACRAEYNALRAALSTPPKPKMKTVWKFSYTYSDELNMLEQFNTEDRAKQRRDMLSRHWDKKAYTNISPVWSEEVEDK